MASASNQLEAKSPSYYLAQSKSCIGDGIFTNVTLKPGTPVIILKRPLLASLESERLKDTCANCFVWTEASAFGSRLYVKPGTTVSACAGCKRFRYCSKACQKAAWLRGHKHECKNLQPVRDREIPKAVLGCMELLVRRKHKLIDDSTWTMLQALDSHIRDFMQNGKYPGIELMAMGTSEFSATQGTFSKEFVAALYARILANALTLVSPSFEPLGIVVDPVLCHLNHACEPNAYVVMDGPVVQVRTLREVREGEELFISYVDGTNPLKRRQGELRERWFFECGCSKCSKGTGTQEDEWAGSPAEMPKDVKKTADAIMARPDFEAQAADYVGDSGDERRLSALQGELFKALEEEQGQSSPQEAVKIIESALGLCKQTQLWPLHRQPLPALRDDLIVNLLAVDNFELAWTHCAIRHRHVTPKLYPQAFHPVRVVQTWQMAMLAQYLASAGAVIRPGADMAVIAAALVKMVDEAAKTSHGTDSAFSKSVSEKWKEVEAEMLARFSEQDGLQDAIKVQEKMLWEMGENTSI